MAVELTAEALRAKLTSVYKQRGDLVPGDFLYDLAEVLANGLYAEWQQALVDGRRESYKSTATGAYLDKWLNFFRIARSPGESDEAARVRLARRIAALWGGVTVNEMMTLLATSLGMDIADIDYVENVGDDGLYEPARIAFTIPSTSFPPDSDIPTLASELASTLNDVAAGGVRVTLTVSGGAVYDVDAYDEPDTTYGP